MGLPLYAENCASCHGANLEGQENWQRPDRNGVLPSPPHDETGHTWHHGDGLLFEYTKFGGAGALARMGVAGFNSGMPEFESSLSDEEIWHILAYIKPTWSSRIKAVQNERSEAEQLSGE